MLCLDQDEARDFYVNTLGFEVRTDITMRDNSGNWLVLVEPGPSPPDDFA